MTSEPWWERGTRTSSGRPEATPEPPWAHSRRSRRRIVGGTSGWSCGRLGRRGRVEAKPRSRRSARTTVGSVVGAAVGAAVARRSVPPSAQPSVRRWLVVGAQSVDAGRAAGKPRLPSRRCGTRDGVGSVVGAAVGAAVGGTRDGVAQSPAQLSAQPPVDAGLVVGAAVGRNVGDDVGSAVGAVVGADVEVAVGDDDRRSGHCRRWRADDTVEHADLPGVQRLLADAYLVDGAISRV